ncbi:Polynucleotidyl transferase ribonuclease H-like superfamily protein [Euphorbia peplus]|nr:Polynucleotidyl transferase ribonuclease H-like superfamily protein [Euphorbia peplus]WCJ40372.1 Polynucleotidyl transferase ribonuclease H-like superfamily protein [Euphorbia peplus]
MQQKKPVIVREVWAENLEVEFALIEEAIPKHPLIALDTEFPGTVVGSNLPWHYISSASPEQIYSLMKQNLDVLKIVQLGLALSDRHGNLPDLGTDSCYIWQFNFRDFYMEKDRYDPEAIQLLEKQGINFKKNREKGIHSMVFGTRWLRSQVIKNLIPLELVWVTFHGAYDIGFLIKILTGLNLPDRLEWFMKSVHMYLGYEVYDLKLMGYDDGLHGGLEKVGKSLGVCRKAGNNHEAGSDSLLTLHGFVRFIDLHLHDFNPLDYQGRLYGLCSKTDQQQHHNYQAPIGIPPHCNFDMFEFYPNHQNYVNFF